MRAGLVLVSAVTLGLGSGCTVLNKTVLHEFNWEPASFHEVSRAPAAIELRFEVADGERWLSVVERWDCIDAATQTGVEVEERKPHDAALGIAAVLGGSATSSAIGLLGGALVGGAINETRTGQQSGISQGLGVGIGIAGAFAQLFAYQKIVEGLNSIRFRRERPIQQELGRKVPCFDRPVQGTLQGTGLPEDGLQLAPRAVVPPGFALTPESQLTLDGRPIEIPADVAEQLPPRR